MYDFKEQLKSCVDLIERSLTYFLPKEGTKQELVSKAMSYSTLSGGKRVRGVLILKFCEAMGGNMQNALPLASAIEMIHASSLIHDDLPCMDDDDMRRGKPSCHVAFDEATALLAGDALINLAFGVVCSEESAGMIGAENAVRASRVLSEYVGVDGMIGGQVVDLISEGKQIDLDTVMYIHKLKTCALIQAAVSMGCIAAGKDDKTIKKAAEYGYNLGLAFQIVDDILDVEGDEKLLGKPIGSDSEQDKCTYVTIAGLEKAKEDAKAYTQKAIDVLKELGITDKFLYDLTNMLLSRNN